MDVWQSACLNEADQVTVLQDQVASKASSRPAGRFLVFPLPQHQNAALLLDSCPHPWGHSANTSTPGPSSRSQEVAACMLFFLDSLDMLIYSRIFAFFGRVACWLMPGNHLAGIQGPLGPPLGLVLEVMKISKKDFRDRRFSLRRFRFL